LAIALSVLPRLTASAYPVGIFKLLAIVLSVLPRLTASTYPVGIFKLLAIVLSVLLWLTLLLIPLVSSHLAVNRRRTDNTMAKSLKIPTG
jgi:CBS domain containing-hemolysin-like protein